MSGSPVGGGLRLLTADELADQLRISTRMVYELAKSGEPRLPAVRIGRWVRFREADVQNWIDSISQSSRP